QDASNDFPPGVVEGCECILDFWSEFPPGVLGFFTVYSTGGVNGFGFESVPKRAQNEADNLCLIFLAPVLFESFLGCERGFSFPPGYLRRKP
ncbi:hypothetical protein ACQ7CH_21445, partial [Providencia sp. R3]|uniref:hypothetical protein n=1 Tax=unclassified Providencia TaxID=2633465 RepID=UPI003D34E4C2